MVLDGMSYDTWEDLFGPLPHPREDVIQAHPKSIRECFVDSAYSWLFDPTVTEPLIQEPNTAHIAPQISNDEELPQSALPGLNLAMNMATTTNAEFDLFRTLAPPEFQDPLALMDAVLKKRDEMMADTSRPGGLTP